MFGRTILVATMTLAMGTPALAQQRGTVEFGGFASHTRFASGTGIDDSFGGGGRVGVFLLPRLSLEVEAGGSRAGRTFGRQDVNIGILAARVTGVPFQVGRVSALLGAGFGHADNHLLETGGAHGEGTSHGQSYGFHGLVGAKFALNDNVALRADWIESFMSNDGDRRRGLHLGVSLYRHPHGRTVTTHTTTVTAPVRPIVQTRDSVSAAEIRRLRAAEARLVALRDSLAAHEVTQPSAAGILTLAERIHFAHDRSDLDDAARTILRRKVTVMRANPEMRIVITGYASQPGTDRYNMALGLRRAEAAKTFLVSEGIASARVEIATRGSELLVEGPGAAADASNRRGEFRVQISDAPPPRN